MHTVHGWLSEKQSLWLVGQKAIPALKLSLKQQKSFWLTAEQRGFGKVCHFKAAHSLLAQQDRK